MPDKPRLHIIIYSPFPHYSGGRENWLFNVLTEFDRRDFPVTLYSYRSNRSIYYDLSKLHSVELVRVPSIRYWHNLFLAANLAAARMLFLLDSMILFPRSVARLLSRNLQPGDIVLAMNPIVDIRPALLLRKKNLNFKLFCSVRGLCAAELSTKMPWLRETFKRMETETLAEADHILANGFDTQAYLQGLGFESEIVPNGVSVERFANPDLTDSALDQVRAWYTAGYKIITMVATLRPVKGIEDLLYAAQVFRSLSDPEFRLVFVGKGSTQRYERLAAQLGLSDQARFVGEQKNVPGFLHYSHIVACLSGGAGMSMSLLEAMAAGQAIVAWNTPVYQQLIQDDETGRLVAFQDPVTLAHTLMELVQDREKAARLGETARQVALGYDWGIVADRLAATMYTNLGVGC